MIKINQLQCAVLLSSVLSLMVACRSIAPTPTETPIIPAPTEEMILSPFKAEVQRLKDITNHRAQDCCTAPLILYALWVGTICHHYDQRTKGRLTSISIREGTADQNGKISNDVLGKHILSEQHILRIARLMFAFSLLCAVVLWRPWQLWPVLYQRLFHSFKIWHSLFIVEIGLIVWIEIKCFGFFNFIQPQRPYTKHLAKAQQTLLITAALMVFAAMPELSPWIHVESHLIHGKTYNLAAKCEWLDEVGTTYVLFECDVNGVFCTHICTAPYIPWSYPTTGRGLEYEPSTNELWIQGMFVGIEYCRYRPPGNQPGYLLEEAH